MSKLRLTPIGLSALVNLALIGLMARALVATPTQAQRYIAVELRTATTSNVQRPTLNVQQPKPDAPRPSVSIQRPKPVIRHLQPIDHRPLTIDHPASLPMPGPSIEVAGSLQSLDSGGGGTSATGPGAYVGSGPGGGTSGSGESTAAPKPSPTPNVQRSTFSVQGSTLGETEAPEPPKPKGESRPPSVAKHAKPVYPPDARDDGVEGTSVVLARIGTDGKVMDTRLEKSSGDRRLDRAALDAVNKWTYNPALRDGVAVKSSVRVRVQFRLE